MPEGDTLFQLAAELRPVLVRQTVITSRGAVSIHPETLAGRTVRDVESRGKHLLLHLDDDTTLHVHLGMTGRFFINDLPSAREPGAGADLVLETGRHRVVGRELPVLERLTSAALKRHPFLSTLGPDVLAEAFDAPAVAERYRREPFAPLGEVLLDQRLACGIGNVYKSEGLFLRGLDPWQRAADTPVETLVALLAEVRGLMRRNLAPGLRRTRRGLDPGRYWVYDRAGKPCRRCETIIAMARQGDLGRSTYYCPTCQHVERPGRKVSWPGRTKC